MHQTFEAFYGFKWMSVSDTAQQAWAAAWRESREALVIERESQEEIASRAEINAAISQMEIDRENQIVRAEQFVRDTGRASISALQRNFKIAYGNACRLMEQLVLRDVVSPIDSEGRRHVLPKARKESK